MSSARLTWTRRPGDARIGRPDGAVLHLGDARIGEVVPYRDGPRAGHDWCGYFWVAGGAFGFGHGIPYKNTCKTLVVTLDAAKSALKAYVVQQLKNASAGST